MHSRPRLYVSDLDGTLLQSDATLSARTRGGLIAAIAQGVPITFATARSAFAARHLLADLSLPLPVITNNGAFVTDLSSGKRHHVHALDFDLAQAALDLLHSHGVTPFALVTGVQGDQLFFAPPANSAMAWFRDEKIAKADPRLCEVAAVRLQAHHQVIGFVALDHPERIEEIAAVLQATLPAANASICADHPYCPGFSELTVQDPGATKANALRKLALDIDVELADITVFGDNDNDVDMFQIAGRAVAVANCSALARSKASEVIGSNDEDAVVRYIEADWRAITPRSAI
jgi:Cof subfamily protein (haloacid dehalogenase superfamily)